MYVRNCVCFVQIATWTNRDSTIYMPILHPKNIIFSFFHQSFSPMHAFTHTDRLAPLSTTHTRWQNTAFSILICLFVWCENNNNRSYIHTQTSQPKKNVNCELKNVHNSLTLWNRKNAIAFNWWNRRGAFNEHVHACVLCVNAIRWWDSTIVEVEGIKKTRSKNDTKCLRHDQRDFGVSVEHFSFSIGIVKCHI